jgi:hypothetical protein
MTRRTGLPDSAQPRNARQQLDWRKNRPFTWARRQSEEFRGVKECPNWITESEEISFIPGDFHDA